jgi:arabinan endo-1,5-alpha-L-arabinosidase
MLYKKQLLVTGILAITLCACADSETKAHGGVQNPVEDKVWYTNPVIGGNTPDPSVIKADDGYFYLYNTGGNTYYHRSKDLCHWEFLGTAFTEEDKPQWEPEAGIWAPDINYINGKYVLYYSMSSWGGGETCGIGVAISDTPQGPFTDLGKLFRSNEIGVHNSIDPFYIEDNGKKYLFWGSWWGIWGVQLTGDGLALEGGLDYAKEHKIQIAAGTQDTRSYEAPYIYKKDNYYYLFCSTGTCCDGANSTYQTVVSRSENLFGPYVTKVGERILDNKHEIFIKNNSDFIANGHNSEIIQDDAGNDWILFHGYQTSNIAEERVVFLERVYWDNDGWPYILENSPSKKAEAPSFKKG